MSLAGKGGHKKPPGRNMYLEMGEESTETRGSPGHSRERSERGEGTGRKTQREPSIKKT